VQAAYRLLKNASVPQRSLCQRLEIAKGTSPRSLNCHCADKTDNIHSAPLRISRVVLPLLNACSRQGRRKPTPRSYAANAGGLTTATPAPQRIYGQRPELAEGASPREITYHCSDEAKNTYSAPLYICLGGIFLLRLRHDAAGLAELLARDQKKYISTAPAHTQRALHGAHRLRSLFFPPHPFLPRAPASRLLLCSGL
jgi:hypothetical protein